MTWQHWIDQAELSLRTATLVLEHDPVSACSRAYYAMFYAARAALIRDGNAPRSFSKTHTGLISAFSERLIKPGLLPTHLSSDISKIAQLRLVADYEGDEIATETATAALEKATTFVAITKAWLHT